MFRLFMSALIFGISLGVMDAYEEKKVSAYDEEEIPQFLYKIASVKEWETSQGLDYLVLSSRDNDFIHFSKEEQLDHVLKKYWSGQDYVLLKVDPQMLIGELVYEKNPGGTNRYYHLYDGKVPLDSILEARIIYKTEA